MMPNFKFSKCIFGSLDSDAQFNEGSPALDRDSKTNQNQVDILQYVCYFHENFCGVSGKQMEQVTLLILCTLRLHREEPVQVTNVMAILWLHEKSRIKNTCLVSYLLVCF